MIVTLNILHHNSNLIIMKRLEEIMSLKIKM